MLATLVVSLSVTVTLMVFFRIVVLKQKKKVENMLMSLMFEDIDQAKIDLQRHSLSKEQRRIA